MPNYDADGWPIPEDDDALNADVRQQGQATMDKAAAASAAAIAQAQKQKQSAPAGAARPGGQNQYSEPIGPTQDPGFRGFYGLGSDPNPRQSTGFGYGLGRESVPPSAAAQFVPLAWDAKQSPVGPTPVGPTRDPNTRFGYGLGQESISGGAAADGTTLDWRKLMGKYPGGGG